MRKFAVMTDQRRLKPITVLMLVCFAATGCDGKLTGLSDSELQDKVYECDSAQSQSPGFAISCDNYRRECKRRRDDGRFVC